MVSRRALPVLATVLLLAATPKPTRIPEPSYMPNPGASRVVTVTEGGAAAAGITVLTEAIAIKETGPRATVGRFGEVYTFSPSFVAVHREEPTEISFWNLQPDDDHDFMLVGRDSSVLMKVLLPALRKTTYVFTFSRGRALHVLLHDASARDERADSGPAEQVGVAVVLASPMTPLICVLVMMSILSRAALANADVMPLASGSPLTAPPTSSGDMVCSMSI
jgi:hypothetical protein